MDTQPKLFPYQVEDASWLSTKKKALLAHEMGTGKSAITIQAMKLANVKRVLIIAPPIARETWKREYKKWGMREPRIILKRSEKIEAPDESVVVSFDYATVNHKQLCKTQFDLIVVDESHFLKAPTAKRTQAVFGTHGVIHKTKRIWLLSGTPMPNNPSELWPMLRSFGATDLSFDQFVSYYCTYYEYMQRKVITGARGVRIPELQALLKPVMLRRTTEEVLKDLPEVRHEELLLEPKLTNLTPELKEEFKLLESSLGKNKTPEEAIAAMSMLASSISTLRRYCAIQKVEALSEILIEELENRAYEKIVIFGIHREALGVLQEKLSRFNPVRIDGSINPIERQRNIDRFQNDGSCRVFIGNIQAAGTNITLTSCHHMVFLEQSWVPGDNQQAVARCRRIGQKNSVFVRHAAIKDTVDQRVQSALASKSFDISQLLTK